MATYIRCCYLSVQTGVDNLDGQQLASAEVNAKLMMRYTGMQQLSPMSIEWLAEMALSIAANRSLADSTKTPQGGGGVVSQGSIWKSKETCHLCGKAGHFFKDCPQKVVKKLQYTPERKKQFHQPEKTTVVGGSKTPVSKKTNGGKFDLANYQCYHCKKMGHLAPDCPSKSTSVQVKRAEVVEEIEDEERDEEGSERQRLT